MLRPDTFALTALLAALTAVGPLSTDMYLPSLPAIGRALDAPTAQVQLTISSYLVGFAVGQIVYGPFADRHGRKVVLLAAISIYTVASLACTLATTIEMLIAARAFQAVGGCGLGVVARAIVRDLYEGSRAGRELSVMGSIMAIAPLVAPIVDGLMQAAFGWRANFLVPVVFGVSMALIVWRLLPETLKLRSPEPLSTLSIVRNYGRIIRNRTFLRPVGILAASYAGLFAWISASAFVLQDLYGLSAAAFGLAFAAGGAGYLIGTLLAARAVIRLGIERTIGVGAMTLAAGGLLMIVTHVLGLPGAPALVASAAVYLAGLGMVLPNASAAALMPYPAQAGTASSLIGVVQQTSAAITGAVVGHLLGASAWPLVGGVATMGCLALALWLLVPRGR